MAFHCIRPLSSKGFLNLDELNEINKVQSHTDRQQPRELSKHE
ncbi:hypothetical protein T11_5734 [Trichinella zimbabwensis]|uniref:Uncharacterized protein n=1 Tax=Trichinella zimbabwensis TaxID=268475 RepID=A0A0V1H637_9BILA|nr:hypothetical protein T11_5734 [Trichinella zimbabwensis]